MGAFRRSERLLEKGGGQALNDTDRDAGPRRNAVFYGALTASIHTIPLYEETHIPMIIKLEPGEFWSPNGSQ